MEVAVRDRGQPGRRDPAEEVVPVEGLPAVDEPGVPAPVARETHREAPGTAGAARAKRMGGDERRPGSPCPYERGIDAVVDADECPAADGDGVCREPGVEGV